MCPCFSSSCHLIPDLILLFLLSCFSVLASALVLPGLLPATKGRKQYMCTPERDVCGEVG